MVSLSVSGADVAFGDRGGGRGAVAKNGFYLHRITLVKISFLTTYYVCTSMFHFLFVSVVGFLCHMGGSMPT